MKYVYEFTNQRKLTKAEFLKWFQKKVLYTIRKFKMIKNNDVIVYENKGYFREVVLKDVLKMFAEKADIKLINRKVGKFTKIALSSTTDTEAGKLINQLVKEDVKNVKNLVPVHKKIIKPLYLFLDKEVMLYAKLKNLKFRTTSEKKNKILNFVDNLEVKHPEIKRAIINSYLELY